MKATHFKCYKLKSKEGFAITLYRFKNNRPQYLGPLGWSNHSQQKDSDIIPLLNPISKIKELTGDDLEKNEFTGLNIYAG